MTPRDQRAADAVADCDAWMRQLRAAPTHAEADRMMDVIRSEGRRRGIARQIIAHCEDVTYRETLEDLGPRPRSQRAVRADITARMTGEGQ